MKAWIEWCESAVSKPPSTICLHVGPVVAVGVLEKDQVRLLGEVQAAVAQLQARRHVQAIGKNGLLVGPAVAVGILEDQNLVVDRLAGQIHRKRAHRGHPQPAAGVERDGHRIAQIGKLDLRSEQIDFVALGHFERLQASRRAS